MRISVVIPHLNQPEALDRCLASLFAGTRLPDEVVVVDNGSADLPAAICAVHPGVTLLSEATPGPGPARNRGVAATKGEVLAFIDADCLADPGWLAAAEAEMTDPAAQILGGDVRIAYADPARITAIEAYESVYAYRMDRYIAREGFTGTGNLVVRRAVLEAVGPFAGLEVAEDRDWGRRANAAGYKIRYVPGMKVYHPGRSSLSEITQKWCRHIAHDFFEARGHTGAWIILCFKSAVMPVSPFFELPRILFSDRLDGFLDRVKAFAALFVIRQIRGYLMLRQIVIADPHRGVRIWNR